MPQSYTPMNNYNTISLSVYLTYMDFFHYPALHSIAKYRGGINILTITVQQKCVLYLNSQTDPAE